MFWLKINRKAISSAREVLPEGIVSAIDAIHDKTRQSKVNMIQVPSKFDKRNNLSLASKTKSFIRSIVDTDNFDANAIKAMDDFFKELPVNNKTTK